MRPTFETSADLKGEQKAIQAFTERYGYDYKKLPVRYELDFVLLKESRVVGAIEVKCRKFSWDRFPDLILSLAKVMKMRQFSEMGIPAGLLLSNEDGLWLWKYADGMQVSWGGRTISPRDDQDSEPVAHIPKYLFSQVTPKTHSP